LHHRQWAAPQGRRCFHWRVLALKEIALMQGGLPKLSEEIWARYSDPK
jgi:hypothetical protein